ncbi:MAG: putative porin, partial [Cyclobacteriaceae bacterium]|nr:putative porin [Cyclobacteriaceae bacterium]
KANSYDLFASYNTKDSSYVALASFRRMYHRVFEYGGVKVDDNLDFSLGELFQENAQPWLTEAESNDLRRNYQLFHQYKVGEALQVYHQLESDRTRNRFYDDYGSEPYKEFFDAVVVDSTLTRDEVKFNTIRNEVGVKGNLLKLFYNGYVTWRNFNMQYKYFTDDDLTLETTGNEFYVGGRIALQLDSLVEVMGHLETMLDDRYKVSGEIKTKWFYASVKRTVSSPTFLQQAYRGSHDEWINSFSPVEASELKGHLIYKSKWLGLYPGIRFSTFRNYVFFKLGDYGIDQTVLPAQSSGYQTLASPELALSIKPFKNTTLSAKGVYTEILENADDAIQVPELFVNTQLAYANILFGGNFDFQIGVDVHWKSSYYAYGYDPAIQQYYTQLDHKTPDFPLMDIFLNAKIIRGRIFLKYNNIMKVFSKSGNVPTPFYPGVVNVFDFGFDWSFFD